MTDGVIGNGVLFAHCLKSQTGMVNIFVGNLNLPVIPQTRDIVICVISTKALFDTILICIYPKREVDRDFKANSAGDCVAAPFYCVG